MASDGGSRRICVRAQHKPPKHSSSTSSSRSQLACFWCECILFRWPNAHLRHYFLLLYFFFRVCGGGGGCFFPFARATVQRNATNEKKKTHKYEIWYLHKNSRALFHIYIHTYTACREYMRRGYARVHFRGVYQRDQSAGFLLFIPFARERTTWQREVYGKERA